MEYVDGHWGKHGVDGDNNDENEEDKCLIERETIIKEVNKYKSKKKLTLRLIILN